MLYESELDSALQEIVNRWEIPGLSVGVVQDGEIVYLKGFGVQSLETRVPVTTDSLFCVASVSKTFVATAVMQLAERGEVDLDAPLVQYLPYFALDDERYPQITIRQVLGHTSGMPDFDEFAYNDLWAHPEYDAGASERYVRGLRDRKLIANPGERFQYSNIAYNVLGDLIAKVSDTSFEVYMKEHILIPAGMPHSTFLMEEVSSELLAVPHLRAPERMVSPIYPYHRADAPSSALHANALEMCHWGMMCLNRGSLNGRDILQPAGFELMWSPVVKRGYPPLYEEMGLGWNLGRYGGEKTVSHGGMGAGLTDFLAILPEQARAAIVMCNEESFAISQTRRAVLDAMVGQAPQAGKVSWVVPISQALVEGGIEAAYARYAALKDGGSKDVFFDPDCLISLALHLMMVNKTDLVIDVLGLNLHAFPEHAYSYVCLAKAYLEKGKVGQAEESLLKAVAIDPDDAFAAGLLEKITMNRQAASTGKRSY